MKGVSFTPRPLYLAEIVRVAYAIGGRAVSRVGLDAMEVEKSLMPLPATEPRIHWSYCC
jgi:hypothetical protein